MSQWGSWRAGEHSHVSGVLLGEADLFVGLGPATKGNLGVGRSRDGHVLQRLCDRNDVKSVDAHILDLSDWGRGRLEGGEKRTKCPSSARIDQLLAKIRKPSGSDDAAHPT